MPAGPKLNYKQNMLQYVVESKLKKSGYGWFTVVNIFYGGGGGGGGWREQAHFLVAENSLVFLQSERI